MLGTILVAEDIERVAQVARDPPEHLGDRVLLAANAEGAPAVLGEPGGAIDLLFTDVMVPGGMNRLQRADQAVRLEPSLPVLLTTGSNDDIGGDAASRAGPDILVKPDRRQKLTDRVCAALAGHSSARHGVARRHRVAEA